MVWVNGRKIPLAVLERERFTPVEALEFIRREKPPVTHQPLSESVELERKRRERPRFKKWMLEIARKIR